MDERETKSEIELMRHACGVDSKNSYYRNFYAAALGSLEIAVWDAMVEKGWAILRRKPGPQFPYYLYFVTAKGKDQLPVRRSSDAQQ